MPPCRTTRHVGDHARNRPAGGGRQAFVNHDGLAWTSGSVLPNDIVAPDSSGWVDAMIDQTHGRETPPALDPHEIHGRPAPARRAAKRARPRRILAAGGAALGLLAVAGVSWAAMSFIAAEPGRPRRGAIVTGSVDYPDLKDGVPALVAPRGQVRVVGTPSSASPAQEVAAMTASPVDSSAMASLAGGGTLPRPTISPASTPLPSAVRPAAIAPQAAPRGDAPKTAASPVPAAPPVPVAPPVSPAAMPVAATATPVPLPTPRPAAATPARTASRSPDAARPAEQPRIIASPATALPPQRASATRPPAPAEPAPDTSAAEDDHINVFGLAVPTIGATGRRIRESVEALGDAVGRL